MDAPMELFGIRRPGTWLERYFPGRKFKPPQFDGKIVVMRSGKQPIYRVRRADLGWTEWATGGTVEYDVPGTHATVLREPHVRKMAQALAEVLDNLQASRGAPPEEQNVERESPRATATAASVHAT